MTKRGEGPPDAMREPFEKRGPWRIATIEMLGDRQEQQDAHTYEVFESEGGLFCAVVVADGHGPAGARIAKHAVEQLHAAITQEAPRAINEWASWTKRKFGEAHQSIPTQDAQDSGTAAILVLMEQHSGRGRYAHVGNCEIRFFRNSGVLGARSVPDMPTRSGNEANRLQDLGAQIKTPPSLLAGARPYLTIAAKDGQEHMIEMSRTLGDTRFEPFLSHEPTMNIFVPDAHLGPDEKEFIIVSTDGFWEYFDGPEGNDELAAIVTSAQNVNNLKSNLEEHLLKYGIPHDNTTAVIVELRSQRTPH